MYGNYLQMNRSHKVKSNVTTLKIIVNNNNVNEPAKFKLFNSGDDVYFRIISKRNRKYNIDNVTGIILKNHYIEININIISTTPDMFSTEDSILVNILDKEYGNIIQTMELPLKVTMLSQYGTQSFFSLPSLNTIESPILRNRAKQLSGETQPASAASDNLQNESLLSPVIIWMLKKLIFLVICSACVIVIVLPLKGFPLTEPHPQDNWVIHLARIWPSNLLPNHLIQYLAILVLGAVMAVFLFIY